MDRAEHGPATLIPGRSLRPQRASERASSLRNDNPSSTQKQDLQSCGRRPRLEAVRAPVAVRARTTVPAPTLDLAPGLLLIGAGAGISMGQLFDFSLAGVGMDEVGSATGVLEAMQQLDSAVGVAALGTIFFSAFADHLPTHALAITAWACLAPIAAAFVLIFRLPMRARERHT